MVDRRGGHRLAPEALAEASLAGVLGPDHLERDRSLERELVRPVHDPHVAEADDLLDAAAGEDGAERELVGGVARGGRAQARRREREAAPAARAGVGGRRRRVGPAAGVGGRQVMGRRAGAGGAGGGGRGAGVHRPLARCAAPGSSGPCARVTRLSVRGSLRRPPLTNVPLADPRSSTSGDPPSRNTRACLRESSGSSPSRPSPLSARPITISLVERQPLALGRGPRPRPAPRGSGAGRPARAPDLGRLGDAPVGVGDREHGGPTRTMSPSSSVRTASRRSPFTNVPFDEPRSSIVSSPFAPRASRAWRRESSGSSPSLPSASVAARPMSSSPSTANRVSRCHPSKTRRCSSAIGRTLRHRRCQPPP